MPTSLSHLLRMLHSTVVDLRISQMTCLLITLVGSTIAAPFMQTEISSQVLDPYPGKPRITFKQDGTLKLTVFSDLHYGENPWDSWGPQQDANSTILIKKVLANERPDYVVLNGDQITGENTFRENSTSLINEILAPLIKAQIPFSTTQGNHDNQANISHIEEILREQEIAPLSYTRVTPGIGGEQGPGNYWVPIYRNMYDNAPILVLWFFDSRGGFSLNPDSVALPDWVDVTVADWIISETATMEKAWGSAEGRGAIAFVHIPPHAIQAVQPTLNPVTNPGLNDDILGDGSVQDSDSTGKDQPFWDALNANVKNLHAVISGHDHGNEWCAREPTKDVIFCFDKHSGYGGYDSPDWGHGVRNLLFHTPDPTASVETWIRLEDGETRARITLDSDYGRASPVNSAG